MLLFYIATLGWKLMFTRMHSYQSAASWRGRCSLGGVSGSSPWPDLSGGRCESVRQHLCRHSWSDCDCKEAEHTGNSKIRVSTHK